MQKGGVSYSGKVQLYRKTTVAEEQARFRFVSNATESLLIVNIYHVVPDDKAVLKRLGNLSNSTQRLTNTYINTSNKTVGARCSRSQPYGVIVLINEHEPPLHNCTAIL